MGKSWSQNRSKVRFAPLLPTASFDKMPIQHIVMMKFKSTVSEEQKVELTNKARALLESCNFGQNVVCGAPLFPESAPGWDLGMSRTFSNRSDLDGELLSPCASNQH